MFALKMCVIDDEVGIILPQQILAKLNVGAEDTLLLTETQDGFRIMACSKETERQIALGREIMEKHRDALSELAKHESHNQFG